MIEQDLHSSKCKLWFSQALTVIVSTDCANQAEELNHPAEAVLHAVYKHTRQDLGGKMVIRASSFIRLAGVVKKPEENIAPGISINITETMAAWRERYLY